MIIYTNRFWKEKIISKETAIELWKKFYKGIVTRMTDNQKLDYINSKFNWLDFTLNILKWSK